MIWAQIAFNLFAISVCKGRNPCTFTMNKKKHLGIVTAGYHLKSTMFCPEDTAFKKSFSPHKTACFQSLITPLLSPKISLTDQNRIGSKAHLEDGLDLTFLSTAFEIFQYLAITIILMACPYQNILG